MTFVEVVINDKTANEVMEIVRDLRSSGLVQGIDFDFAFRPAKFDNFSGDAVYNSHVEFTFYKEKYATFFTLKYGN